ncbi:MAG: WXG100 family type VII secretion target [Lachnospiraceae bacterium]|nr:WXG100 family type VII secretion target [Lachnospiraceae bacterium]MCR5768079.1 WXG100 family type VII secretion target [Lachnospiraceae bacterium]
MATQQVNATKLKKAGNELTNLSTKIKAEVTKLDENMQKVSSIWSSDASAAYLKQYNADKSSFNELVQVMKEMGTALTQFSAKYQQADNKASDLVHKYLKK